MEHLDGRGDQRDSGAREIGEGSIATKTLTYTVRDPSSAPVAGALVSLAPLTADGSPGFFYGSTRVGSPFTAISDAAGVVTFRHVPPNGQSSDPGSSYRVEVQGRSEDGRGFASSFYVVVPDDGDATHDLSDIAIGRPARVTGRSPKSMTSLISVGRADVGRIRESTRRRRLLRMAIILGGFLIYLVYRDLNGYSLGLPHLGPDAMNWLPAVLLIVLLGGVLVIPMLASGRSPHVLIRPEHIEVGLSDVQGLDGQVEEVIRSLNVFLGYATFKDVLGGNPRRGILFDGPPGTGKTYLAKAMAKQAGVPFMFVSAPAFQSMFYGMTAVRIRAFFKALRKAARRSGGAIGFIEEIDAIGAARGSVGFAPMPDGVDGTGPAAAGGRSVNRTISEGTSGVVNELLIQMQSFDQPPLRRRILEKFTEWLNGYLPDGQAIKAGKPTYHNILLIAATNRSDAMDPALLRPGRFDRRLFFDLPTKNGRRDLIDYFMERKAHDDKLDKDTERDRIAHDTFGYTPVMVEHLFDEALLLALRDGRSAMTLSDIYEAKITEETGLKQAVAYGEDERSAIATHEAGHATAAFLLGTTRRLEILSIIKRQSSLGLLAHGDTEERYTRSRSELEALIAIALGGMAAEELFLGETTTGPGADLAGATSAAATMVGALGMGGSLTSYEAVDEGFVGRRNLVGRVLADRDGKAQVEAILATQKERVVEVLDDNRDLVEALRDALIERDELVRDEILDVIHVALERRRPDLIVLPESDGRPVTPGLRVIDGVEGSSQEEPAGPGSPDRSH
jgi:ATP-dependent Zn protease